MVSVIRCLKMKIKEYFDIEMSSNIIHSFTGLVAGYASFLSNQATLGLIVMIVILGITVLAVKTLLKLKKDSKWWFSNGIVVFIFTWLVIWTIFYNLQLYSTLP